MIGRCEIFAELARGGMATIHIGRWRGGAGLSKLVAIKALHPQFAGDEEFVRMFRDEARMVARIRHPNVVAMLDFVEGKNNTYIVMEYVHGVTLSHLIAQTRKRGERIPADIVMRIMSEVLQGLHAAHEATNELGEAMNIIHRDVTPQNILVGADGHARLIDFGVARALGRSTSTHTGQIKGKWSYLAPEQLKSMPLTRRVDVYGASVTMWRALTGARLFPGNSPAEVAYAILRDDVMPPSAFVAGVPEMLDQVVLKGMARNVVRRWQTAHHMAEAIERIGGLASNRRVARWVQSIAAERLEMTSNLVQEAERAPRSSIISIVPPAAEAEPSRTLMTSEADLSAMTEAPARHSASIGPALVALVLAAGAMFSIGRETPRRINAALPEQLLIQEVPAEQPASIDASVEGSADPPDDPSNSPKSNKPEGGLADLLEKSQARHWLPADI